MTVVAPARGRAAGGAGPPGRISLERRAYRPGEAAGYVLVFAATDDREVNRQVFDGRRPAGCLGQRGRRSRAVQLPPSGAGRSAAPLQIAVASGGEAPFAVRRLRQLLERRLGPEWGEWMEAAARFRQPRPRAWTWTTSAGGLLRSLLRRRPWIPAGSTARVPTDAEERAWLDGGDRGERPPSPDRPAGRSAPAHRARRGGAPGLVSLVGAGPGCAGLLTVRGRQRLMAADAVVYDRLAAAALPCDLPVPRRAALRRQDRGPPPGAPGGDQRPARAAGPRGQARRAAQGRRPLRLRSRRRGGRDPGRGGRPVRGGARRDLRRSRRPAWAGIPVTHRGEAVRLTLLTAHESDQARGPPGPLGPAGPGPARDARRLHGSHDPAGGRPRSCWPTGMDPETPAALVQHGTLAVAAIGGLDRCAELPDAVDARRARTAGPVRHRPDGPPRREPRLVPSPAPGRRAAAWSRPRRRGWSEALEAAGAEVVRSRAPLTPATRVVIGADPLTGCVLRSAAEVDALDDERGRPRLGGPARSPGASGTRRPSGPGRAAGAGSGIAGRATAPESLVARIVERRGVEA